MEERQKLMICLLNCYFLVTDNYRTAVCHAFTIFVPGFRGLRCFCYFCSSMSKKAILLINLGTPDSP